MIAKKTFSKIILCITALGAMQQTHAITDQTMGLGFAATSISLAVMNEELAEAEWFETLAGKINVNKDDLAPCLVFGSALWAASYIPEGNARYIMRAGALLPALTAACLPRKAINKLAQLPGIRHYFALMRKAKGLPLIGDYAQCDQLGCKGLCTKCKARKLYLAVPFAAIPFVPTIVESFKATVARWEHERIALDYQRRLGESAQYFEVLGIPFNEQLTEDILRRAYRARIRQNHPDKNQNINAHTEAVRINQAHEALRDLLRNRAHQAPQQSEAAHNSDEAQSHDSGTPQSKTDINDCD